MSAQKFLVMCATACAGLLIFAGIAMNERWAGQLRLPSKGRRGSGHPFRTHGPVRAARACSVVIAGVAPLPPLARPRSPS
eukprot:1354690-Prymnesium_polylepis.1